MRTGFLTASGGKGFKGKNKRDCIRGKGKRTEVDVAVGRQAAPREFPSVGCDARNVDDREYLGRRVEDTDIVCRLRNEVYRAARCQNAAGVFGACGLSFGV